MLLLPVPYEQHPMVKHPGVTLWLPVHTSAVELERLVAGVNGDAARSLGCNGVHQLHLIAGLNINKPDVCGSFPPWVVAALVILSLIGVAPLRVNAPILLDILEGIVHQATRFCSLRLTSFPVFLKFIASRAPVVEDDQQD